MHKTSSNFTRPFGLIGSLIDFIDILRIIFCGSLWCSDFMLSNMVMIGLLYLSFFKYSCGIRFHHIVGYFSCLVQSSLVTNGTPV